MPSGCRFRQELVQPLAAGGICSDELESHLAEGYLGPVPTSAGEMKPQGLPVETKNAAGIRDLDLINSAEFQLHGKGDEHPSATHVEHGPWDRLALGRYDLHGQCGFVPWTPPPF